MPFKSFVVSLVMLVVSALASAAPPAQTDVLIVGAGLSGLATAYQLRKAGLSYHILELTPRIGGRVRTVRYEIDGEEVYADSGMEEYWESNPAVKILEDLKLPVRGDVALSSLVVQKKLYALGDEDRPEFLKKILSGKGYAALEKFKTKVSPMVHEIHSAKGPGPALMKLKDVAFSKWVADQKLPPAVADWIRVSLECEIGTEWNRISALDGLAEFHIFLGEGEKSYRVLGGNEKFTDALAKAVGHAQISLNKKVNRIVTRDGKVSVYYLDTQTNESAVVRAKHVVSTIPLYRVPLDVQFEPPLSAQKLQAISSQTWGAYFKAHIFLNKPAERFWINGDASMLPLLSDSELGVIYDANPDQNAKTRVVSLLVTGSVAEAFNLMPLDLVRARIGSRLEKLWPGISKEVKGMEFYRFHPRAIASWPVGRSRYDTLSNALRQPENGVYFAGDFTESTHSDGAFISAARVAKQIVGEKK